MGGMVGGYGARGTGNALRGDRGDIVLGWLTKLVVALGVVAVIGFDGVEVGLAKVQIQDQANEVAVAARDAYADHHDLNVALKAAETKALEDDPANVIVKGSLVVEPNGTVSLQLTRPIHTVLAHYLPAPSLRTASAGGSASPTVG
jgi:hypothetical protein